jgi:hypothetical protein
MRYARNAYSISVAKPEGKRPLGRPSCSWKDNIRIDLRKIGWEFVEWSNLAQDSYQWWAIVKTVMNRWVA